MELFIRKRKIKDTLHFPARAIMDCSFNIKEKRGKSEKYIKSHEFTVAYIYQYKETPFAVREERRKLSK